MKIGVYTEDGYYLRRICHMVNKNYKENVTLLQLKPEQISIAINDKNLAFCILDKKVENASIPIAYWREEKIVEELGDIEVFKYQKLQDLFGNIYGLVDEFKEREEKVRAEREAKEKAEREAREVKEREAREAREAQEREAQVRAKREAQERAEREAQERAKIEAREREEKERLTENTKKIVNIVEEENIKGELGTKIVTFVSIGGGYGASTIASAAALHYESMGFKVLYMNLKMFDKCGYFDFNAEGNSYKDLILSVKAGSINDKINDLPKQKNLYFLGNYRNVGEATKTSKREFMDVIMAIDEIGQFDVVVADVTLDATGVQSQLFEVSTNICLVADESKKATIRLYNALQYFYEIGMDEKTKIIYNKYKKMPQVDKTIESKIIGGVGFSKEVDTIKIINNSAKMKLFEKLI